MKEYFQIQYIMLQRRLNEVGVNPALGILLSLVSLVLLTEYLFSKSEFGGYILLLLGLAIPIRLADSNRTEFLITAFGDDLTRQIRILENTLLALPFLAVLIWKAAFLPAAILIICSLMLAAARWQFNVSMSLPTPFKKHPYEFTVGFRNTFFMFPIAYALTVIALIVDNMNLGIFSLVLVFLVCMTYYSKPEGKYYVWSHAQTTKTFLFQKLKMAIRNSFVLNLPILFALITVYPAHTWMILLIYAFGLILLSTVVLAKYAAYPGEMNLPEGILLALSLQFPPLLLFTVPFFYTRSLQKLALILHD